MLTLIYIRARFWVLRFERAGKLKLPWLFWVGPSIEGDIRLKEKVFCLIFLEIPMLSGISMVPEERLTKD